MMLLAFWTPDNHPVVLNLAFIAVIQPSPTNPDAHTVVRLIDRQELVLRDDYDSVVNRVKDALEGKPNP